MTESNALSTLSLPNHDWPAFEAGWVWLCGAGPGDAGLLTLHAVNALKQADVVVYDALVSEHILGWANPDAEMIFAGKRGGRPSPKQADITDRLIELAKSGRKVLRLKGGDPFVFGRGGEEAQVLVQNGVPIRIIPGISAGIGGLAYAGIPVTHRDVNQAVTFVTGHDRHGNTPDAIDWHALAKGSNVLVIYMGIKHAAQIQEKLIEGGRPKDEPAAVVYQASHPAQRVLETTLENMAADIEKTQMSTPSIICIGRAVLMRQVLDWQALMEGRAPRDLDPLGIGTPS